MHLEVTPIICTNSLPLSAKELMAEAWPARSRVPTSAYDEEYITMGRKDAVTAPPPPAVAAAVAVNISRHMAINEVGNKSSGINRRPHLCTLRGRALGGGHAKAMSITGAACTGIFAKRYFFNRTRCECARPTRRHVKKDP
jgi:hypothetical protein